MLMWIAQAIFYLTMAAGVTWLSWKHPIAALGIGLVGISAVSSFAFFSLPFDARVLGEICMAWMLGICATVHWRSEEGRHRAYQVILGLCLADVAFCGGICLRSVLYGPSPKPVEVLFDWVANIIFVMQCLCVAAPGGRDAYVGWIDAIKHQRSLDSANPDFDWLLSRIDCE